MVICRSPRGHFHRRARSSRQEVRVALLQSSFNLIWSLGPSWFWYKKALNNAANASIPLEPLLWLPPPFNPPARLLLPGGERRI